MNVKIFLPVSWLIFASCYDALPHLSKDQSTSDVSSDRQVSSKDKGTDGTQRDLFREGGRSDAQGDIGPDMPDTDSSIDIGIDSRIDIGFDIGIDIGFDIGPADMPSVVDADPPCVDLWCSTPSPTSKELLGLWGTSSTDVWAVGWTGTIIHWDGSMWSIVQSSTPQALESIWGSADNDVWAVGWTGAIVHWDGIEWSPVDSHTEMSLRGVWGSAANDVWAVGWTINTGGIILHWDGTDWKS